MADLSSEDYEYQSEESAWGVENQAASQIVGDTSSRQLGAANFRRRSRQRPDDARGSGRLEAARRTWPMPARSQIIKT
jgi:hypothetical protein